LREVGGHIHRKLIENVEQRNGHLEKREYYCYKCSGMMSEPEKDKFKCSKCNVTYDLNKFKWLSKKWTEVHRRRQDYPGSSSSGNYGNNSDIMPF
jgi:tRNA(Ile2) C34 agmatinyltransferase TiaS